MMKPSCRPVTLYNGKQVNILHSSVACDPNKFKQLLKERDLIAADISRELGFAANTLSGQLNAGAISGPMVSGLQRVFNISREDYEYTVPLENENASEEEKAVEKSLIPTDETALYEVFKSAMVDAINEALSVNAKQIRGTIASAVAYAVRAEINRKEE